MAQGNHMSSKTASTPARVANMVHSAAIHLLRRLRKSDMVTGLSPARLSVLSVLVFAGGKTPGELAQIEQVKPPTMTKLIQALENEGLVMRRVLKHDKRALMVKVTAKGRRKLVNAQQLRVRNLAKLMNSLNQEELRTLANASKLMEKLAALPHA